MITVIFIVDSAKVEHLPPRRVAPGERVLDLLRRVLVELNLDPNPENWELLFEGRVLPHETLIGSLPGPAAPVEITLTLHLRRVSKDALPRVASPQAPAPAAPPMRSAAPGSAPPPAPAPAAARAPQARASAIPPAPAAPAPPPRAQVPAAAPAAAPPPGDVEFDECVTADDVGAESVDDACVALPGSNDALEEDVPAAMPRGRMMRSAKTAKARPRQAERRATVRYYDRMNPQRVYPLLVAITEEMVKRVATRGTEQQASGPFQVDLDTCVEVEPVLPGCACYPPQARAWLDAKNLTLTFHVVPHVLGEVTGAHVLIRQDHRTLSRVDLNVKVVQRTTVYLCGLLTFLLPFLSAIAKHLGLDFQTQQETGFSLYLSLAQTLVHGISPLTLTALLAVLTGVLYWWTRPRARDAFWDLEVVKPDEMLRQIQARRESSPSEASRDLRDLLTSHPNYQPALLLYARWHYESENHDAALSGYERAFRAGRAKAGDYLRASLAASRLGQNEKALEILENATALLPEKEVGGTIWYNRACYHARLGQLNQVVPCLRKAVQSGFRKVESFRDDPDLQPVRDRKEFSALLTELGELAR